MDTIGNYQILRELGRGGMATVYLAVDPRFDREVAVKVLPRQFLHDSSFRTRFEREAQMIARLEHPAIVPVYDFGEENDQPYLVMRYMPGGSLAERLTNRPMSLKEALPIIERISSALQVAHDQGIVHRDLKPGNILFDQFDNPYLSDFGIAKLAAQTQTFTQGILGTPAFMSPEQWRAKDELDGRTDQYALAIILYKLLSGDLPYKANETAGYMVAHISEPVPDILAKLPELPNNVNNLLQKGLAKDREDRFATIDRFATAFRAVAEGQRIPATFFQTRPPAASKATEVVPASENVRPATMRLAKPDTQNRVIPARPETHQRPIQRPEQQPTPRKVRPLPAKNGLNSKLTKWALPAIIGIIVVALLGVGQATGMLGGILGGGSDGGDGGNIGEITPESGELISPPVTPSPTSTTPAIGAADLTATAEAETPDIEPTAFATDTPLPTFTPSPTYTSTPVPPTKTFVPTSTATKIPTATFTPVPTATSTQIPPSPTPLVVLTPVQISTLPVIQVTLIPIKTPTPTKFPIIGVTLVPVPTLGPIIIPTP